MNNDFICNPGDYVVLKKYPFNNNYAFIVGSYSYDKDYLSRKVVKLLYAAECEITATKSDQYGNPIWKVENLHIVENTPFFGRSVRAEDLRLADETEKKMIDDALLKLGFIWNPKRMRFDERPLPDISKGLLLNEDTKYCWHKVLKPYIGKVYFSETEDSQENVYSSTWNRIWNIILKEKMRREEKTGKRSCEMEEHMFEVLRTIYQAPLLKVSYDFQNEKQASKAFIVAEKNNRYEEGRGFVMGEPKLHLVTNMVYLTSAVCRYDMYKQIKDPVFSDLRLYFPKSK